MSLRLFGSSHSTVQTSPSIERWLYSIDQKKHQTRLQYLSMCFSTLPEISNSSFAVYLALFLSSCYLLFTFIFDYERYIGTGRFQYPTFREYAFALFEEYFYYRTYYTFFSGLISYSLVTWLKLSGSQFWVLLVGLYLIMTGLMQVLFSLINVVIWGLRYTECAPLAFLGVCTEWAKNYAFFDFRTSTAMCMLLNLFWESSLLEFGWQLMALWSCCWVLPGLWARLILVACYPIIYIFLMRLPLIWYACFALLHHWYTRLVFCVVLVCLVSLAYLGVLDPLWYNYSQRLFFGVYAVYGILAAPVTLEHFGLISTNRPAFVDPPCGEISKHFGQFGGVCIPLNKEAAIGAFQRPLIDLLGVQWYTWAYGEEIYCGADSHLYAPQHSLYEILFVVRCFWDYTPYFVPSADTLEQGYAAAWADMIIALSVLYEFRWDKEARDRIGPSFEGEWQLQKILMVGLFWCFCGGILAVMG